MAEDDEEQDKEEQSLEADANLQLFVEKLYEFAFFLCNLQHFYESNRHFGERYLCVEFTVIFLSADTV